MIPDIYRAEDIDFSSTDVEQILAMAKDKAFTEERPIRIFKNGEKAMTIGQEIYKVKDTNIKTFSLVNALAEAKRLAQQTKKSMLIILNGSPFRLIDKQGKLAIV